MKIERHHIALVTGILAAGLLAGACQGRTSFFGGAGGGAGGARGGGEIVSLTAQDLAPVDEYISTRNSQWILGDDVEVIASKEYFAQNLTVNATVGLHERTDTTTANETLIKIRYLGQSASAMTNPRVLIGTGLTITARRTLTVRLYKTQDSSRPLALSVTARGEAVRGRKEEVLERGDLLRLGGEIRRVSGRYTWTPFQ